MATGGAEQERKGAPWRVRVSMPVRPELCLSDRQRREKTTKEKRSFRQNTKREACVSQTRTRQKPRGGGGWVGASSSRCRLAACRWPVPSGQATEERRQKKRTTEKSKAGKDKEQTETFSEPYSQYNKNKQEEQQEYP